MRLNFTVNAEELVAELENFKQEAKKAIEDGVKSVAEMTHAKITELAQSKLHQTRSIYTDNLDFKEVSPGVWLITLDQPALWIEEGRKSGDMTEDLLRKGAKISADGHRYKAIPFEQSKSPSKASPYQTNLIAKIKAAIKAENVVRQSNKKELLTYKKLQVDEKGSPRLGLVDRLKVSSSMPSSRASYETLAGLAFYQTKTKSGKVRRDVMTFRIVSDKHKGSKWIHPGREPSNFFEEALAWADRQFEDVILPEIMNRFK